MIFRRAVLAAAGFALSACASALAPGANPQAQFWSALATLCGKSGQGKLIVGDPVLDKDFAANPLVMGPVVCAPDKVEIPFSVGADASRTWIITRTASGLRLKHRHLHDSKEEALSQYGGDTVGVGAADRQEFPADAFSKDLFLKQNRPASVANIWALEVTAHQRLAYELKRPGRHVRVEFATK
ncbi:MAG: hypothetical protein ACOYJ6_06975 [Caulobacterales bacterium]|jgi:hypothetical protein